MKRSRSGTASPDNKPGPSGILLIIALAIVLSFAGSLIFGLRRSSPEVAEHKPEAIPQPAVVNDRRAKVEVQNASGKSGLAKLATQQLRDAEFDVVQFGNAGAPSATSQVIDRVGKPEVAKAVAEALGILKATTAIDSSRFVDATVVLGRDWPPKKPQK